MLEQGKGRQTAGKTLVRAGELKGGRGGGGGGVHRSWRFANVRLEDSSCAVPIFANPTCFLGACEELKDNNPTKNSTHSFEWMGLAKRSARSELAAGLPVLLRTPRASWVVGHTLSSSDLCGAHANGEWRQIISFVLIAICS